MRSVVSVTSAVTVATGAWLFSAGVAMAETGVVYDGDDPGPGFTPLEALGLFAGIPLLLLIVIVFAVYGPGWIRGRGDDVTAPEDAMWITSPAGTMSAPTGPGMLPATPTDHEERGGASARW